MHRARAYISAVLVAILLSVSVSPAFAVSQADLLKHQKAAAAARRKAASGKAPRRTPRQTRPSCWTNGSTRCNPRSTSSIRSCRRPSATESRLQAQVQRLRPQVAALERSIAKTQAEYDRQSGLLEKRLSATYREGNWYYLDILLGAKDFGDLIDRSEFINRVIEANRRDAIDARPDQAQPSDRSGQDAGDAHTGLREARRGPRRREAVARAPEPARGEGRRAAGGVRPEALAPLRDQSQHRTAEDDRCGGRPRVRPHRLAARGTRRRLGRSTTA